MPWTWAPLRNSPKLSGNSERGLRSIMNALVGFNFLAKSADGRYALTPESSAFLVSSKPAFLGKFVEFSGLKMIQTWLPLPEVVKNGKPSAAVNQQRTGDSFFQELVEPIFAMSYPATQLAGRALGLADAKNPIKQLDIGTGSGVWGIGLAQQSPQISVTAQGLAWASSTSLAGWPPVLAWPIVSHTSPATSRRSILAPATTWSPSAISSTARASTAAGSSSKAGRRRPGRRREPSSSRNSWRIRTVRSPYRPDFLPVNMLAHTDNGDTFSFSEEISGWLKEAGLVNPRKLETGGPVGLVLADKP